MPADSWLISVFVLLDLSAAFDTVDHNILLQTLEHFVSIKGAVLQCFESYLQNRFPFPHENGECFLYRAPQGTVLGPVLFTLYSLPSNSFLLFVSQSSDADYLCTI